MASLKEKLQMKFLKMTSSPIDIGELVGCEITIRHDSGTWEKAYVIGQDSDGNYLKFERFFYDNPNSGKPMPEFKGIHVSPVGENDVFHHVKDDIYLMSSPNDSSPVGFSERFPESDREDSGYRRTDDYLKSIGH